MGCCLVGDVVGMVMGLFGVVIDLVSGGIGLGAVGMVMGGFIVGFGMEVVLFGLWSD